MIKFKVGDKFLIENKEGVITATFPSLSKYMVKLKEGNKIVSEKELSEIKEDLEQIKIYKGTQVKEVFLKEGKIMGKDTRGLFIIYRDIDEMQQYGFSLTKEQPIHEAELKIEINPKVEEFLSTNWSQFTSTDEAEAQIEKIFKVTKDKAKAYVKKAAEGKAAFSPTIVMDNKEDNDDFKTQLAEVIARLNTVSEQLATTAAEKIVLESRIKEAEAKVAEFVGLLHESNQLKESKEKEKVNLAEKFVKDRVKLYTETKLKCMGLQLPEAIQTLFDSCKSNEEVDALIEKVQDTLREGILHFNNLSEVEVANQELVDPKRAEITKNVGLALAAMGQPIK